MPKKLWLPKTVRAALTDTSNLEKLFQHGMIDQATYDRLKSKAPVSEIEQEPERKRPVKKAVPTAPTPAIAPTEPTPTLTEPPTLKSMRQVRAQLQRSVICTPTNNYISCMLEDVQGEKTVIDCDTIELGYHSRVRANIRAKQSEFFNVSRAELLQVKGNAEDVGQRVLVFVGQVHKHP